MFSENVQKKRFVFTGPESTGKTTLSEICADKYSGIHVPEAARYMISDLQRPYQYQDLLEIAREQIEIQVVAVSSAKEYVFQDTDLLTIRIWAMYKYGKCEEWINTCIWKHLPDLYFLCHIDWPWVFDPQREHPEKREELYDIYYSELNKLPGRYVELKGSLDERLSEIDKYL